ncbi:MAG: hypothetical protein AB8H80_23655 [Planctomycetota bacterium]
MSQRKARDWSDRAMDSGLQELHGSRPPDLSARIAIALEEQAAAKSAGASVMHRLPSVRGKVSHVQLAAALLAAMLVGLSVAIFVLPAILPAPAVSRESETRMEQAVAFDVEVLTGAVVCVARDGATGAVQTQSALAGGALPFVARPGSRLRCDRASALRLGAFGVVVAQENTELEVKDMAIEMKQGVLMASSLTVAVVAGVITWQAMARTETASDGELVTLEAQADGSRFLAAENEDLRNRIARLEDENRDLRMVADRHAAPVLQQESAEQPDAVPDPAVGMTFSDPRYADALAKVDWAKMGKTTHEMSPILAELVAAMTKEGAEIPMELAIKVEQLNSHLLGQVPALMEAGVPGFGVNGSYTHPLVVANTLASTLAAAGHSMTPEQQDRMSSLVSVFSKEAQAIADTPHDLPLDQLLAETEMKERFFGEMKGALTMAQSGAIYPEGSQAYEGGSLFNTGVVMRPTMKPVSVKNAAEFASKVSRNLGEKLGLDPATTKQVQDIISRVSSAAELWRHSAAPAETSQAHFLRSGRSLTALRNQVVWMRQIRQLPNITPKQREKLGQMTRVLVPLPQ